jgi:hypothetical protein
LTLTDTFDVSRRNQKQNRIYNHSLVCYYSDQRDPLHGQKLSHQVSSDLRTWAPPVDDVAYDEYIARPGMTVVAFIPPIKKWIVADADNSPVYTNRFGGDVDRWEIHATPAGATYSRAIHVLGGRPDSLMIFGGETFDDMRSGLLTPFTATVVSLEETLRN